MKLLPLERQRPLYICYRSFKPQLERTGDFAEMGVATRCFFAANTINAGGKPYCDYPLIWKGFKDYDWSALDIIFDLRVGCGIETPGRVGAKVHSVSVKYRPWHE